MSVGRVRKGAVRQDLCHFCFSLVRRTRDKIMMRAGLIVSVNSNYVVRQIKLTQLTIVIWTYKFPFTRSSF